MMLAAVVLSQFFLINAPQIVIILCSLSALLGKSVRGPKCLNIWVLRSVRLDNPGNPKQQPLKPCKLALMRDERHININRGVVPS